MDRKTLRQDRFALFVRQYGDERQQKHGWKSDLARRIKKTPSAVSQYAAHTLRADADTVQLAIDVFGIDPAFFYDPSLGEAPNYRDFIGKKPQPIATESRVERAPIDESSMDQWKVFKLTDEYKRASNEAKAGAEDLHNQDLRLSVGQYIRFVENHDAKHKGKVAEDPEIITSIQPKHMRIAPAKKAR